jgi:hypothetical protein
LELLKLAALWTGVEAEPGVGTKTTRGEVVLATALREGSAIPASAKAQTGGEVAPASLTQRAEDARGAGTFAGGIGVASHGVWAIATGHRSDTSLAAPVKP